MILTDQLIPCSSSQLGAIPSLLMTLMAANQRREKDATAQKQEPKEERKAWAFVCELHLCFWMHLRWLFVLLKQKLICFLELSKHVVDTHLVSPQSSWHSNQSLKHYHPWWTPGWWCCFCLWWVVARRSQYSRLQSKRRPKRLSHSSPSRLSRRHP